MKRKNTISKSLSQRDPFIAGFILPVLLLAAFSPTLLFQEQGDVEGAPYYVGDPPLVKEPPVVETAEQKEARMLKAFDNPNMIAGQLIVSFTDGTSLEQANAILQSFGLKIDEKEICLNAQTEDPNGTSVTSGTSCYMEGWFSSITAGRVLVTIGQEKTMAQQLYSTPGIIWVEPNYTESIADSSPSLGVEDTLPSQNADAQTTFPPAPLYQAASNTILGIEPLMWVLGVLVVGFGAFFLMKK